ncbi:MAG: hypothetical protein L6R37_005689 [Teloschistes peruensis]|nr:MAG: hypothetical protein L6R37_005689 [Teloschistes peruensis]
MPPVPAEKVTNSHIHSLTTYLHSIRQAYLRIDPPPHHRLQQQQQSHKRTHSSHSPTPPIYFTNPQRDQLDAESKSLLRSLHASIHQLEEAETLRQETARKLHQHKYSHRFGFGAALGRWAAGGDNDVGTSGSPEEQWEQVGRETLKTWRESVIWYLKKKLEEAGETQRSMMDRRLQREVERSKSSLYKSRTPRGVDIGLDDPYVGGEGKGMNGTAEKSMLEVSELQTTLVANLETQSSNIEQLVADSLNTTENIGSGNKELKRATERKSTARMVFFVSCGLCAFLVSWDLVF